MESSAKTGIPFFFFGLCLVLVGCEEKSPLEHLCVVLRGVLYLYLDHRMKYLVYFIFQLNYILRYPSKLVEET